MNMDWEAYRSRVICNGSKNSLLNPPAKETEAMKGMVRES